MTSLSISELQEVFFNALSNIHSIEGVYLLMDYYKKERQNSHEETSLIEKEVIDSKLKDSGEDIPGMTTIKNNGYKYIFSIEHLSTHFKDKNKYDIIAFVGAMMEHIIHNTNNIINIYDKSWSVDYDISTCEEFRLGFVKLNDENRSNVFYGKRKNRSTYSKLTNNIPDTTQTVKVCLMTKIPKNNQILYKNNSYTVGDKKVYIINTIFPVLTGYTTPSSEVDDILLNRPVWLFKNTRTNEEYSIERVKQNLTNNYDSWCDIALYE